MGEGSEGGVLMKRGGCIDEGEREKGKETPVHPRYHFYGEYWRSERFVGGVEIRRTRVVWAVWGHQVKKTFRAR